MNKFSLHKVIHNQTKKRLLEISSSRKNAYFEKLLKKLPRKQEVLRS